MNKVEGKTGLLLAKNYEKIRTSLDIDKDKYLFDSADGVAANKGDKKGM